MADKLRKTILREKLLEQIGKEAVVVFKGLKEALPNVDNSTIQSMTATLLISVDKSATYTMSDFDVPAVPAPNPATVAEKPLDYRSMEQVQKDELAQKLQSAAAYDATEKKWHTCPACSSEDINHTNTSTGRNWQGCKTDKIFLNPDGTVKPYKQDVGQKRI